MTDDRVASLARALADDLRSQELRSAENVRAVKFAENLWLETRDLTMVGIDGRIDLHDLARAALAWMEANPPPYAITTSVRNPLYVARQEDAQGREAIGSNERGEWGPRDP